MPGSVATPDSDADLESLPASLQAEIEGLPSRAPSTEAKKPTTNLPSPTYPEPITPSNLGSQTIVDSLAMYAHALGSEQPLSVAAGPRGADPLGNCELPSQPFAIVGRAPQCDITLDDQTISQRHLLLHGFRDRLFAVDLFSANGCKVGKERFRSGWIGTRPAFTAKSIARRPAFPWTTRIACWWPIPVPSMGSARR